MSTIEELEKRRTERRAALAKAYRDQLAIDLAELDRLEEERGAGQIVRINVDEARYYPGLVTMALYRLPSASEAKRWKDMSKPRKDGSPGDTTGASDLLAASCRLYPDADAYRALSEHYAFVNTNGALGCIRAAEGQAEEEGKG